MAIDPKYKPIFTVVGMSKIADAINTGVKIELKSMALGDSNGTDYTPTETMTALVREVIRFDLRTLWYEEITATNKTALKFTGVLEPGRISSKTIREVGVYDKAGDLIIIFRIPDRPVLTDGNIATVLDLTFGISLSTNSNIFMTLGDTTGNYVTLTEYNGHVNNKNNPHDLNKGQIGLSLVDNTRDIDKAVATATKLATPRTIALSGDISGSATFDGSANISITSTLPNVVTAGTYKSVTVNAKGLITSGTNPTTLDGYGITDAVTASRATATFDAAADTWYRIATSILGIGKNSGVFAVDWSRSGQHGAIRFTADCMYGNNNGTSLMQQNYSKYAGANISEARVVYHNSHNTNYAYLEVKFSEIASAVTVNVELQDSIGWILTPPNTAGMMPAGYLSKTLTFISSAEITAGTFPKVTFNQEGRVTAGAPLLVSDVPLLNQDTTGNAATATGAKNQTAGTGVTCAEKFNNTPAHSTSFSECNNVADAPNTGWWLIYSIRHSNSSNYWGTQIAYGFSGNANQIWQRNIDNGTWSAWTRVDVSGANISELVNNVGYITTEGRAYPKRVGGVDMNFNWSGQGGQPNWLWGGNDGTNHYVYNPSNFNVNYANTAGNADTATRAKYQTRGAGTTCAEKFTNTPADSASISECNNVADAPNTGWWMIHSIRHSNGSNYWGVQMAYGWENNASVVYQRNVSSGVWGSWVNTSMVRNMIILWSGSISTIPNGWYLCDGSNGTPDLRNKFVYGASANSNVGLTGGSKDAVVVSHNHGAYSDSQGNHTHATWTDSQGSHAHTIEAGISRRSFDSGITEGSVFSPTPISTSSAGAHGHNIGMNGAGVHAHNIIVNSNGESGTDKNLPPYMLLAYIMKG